MRVKDIKRAVRQAANFVWYEKATDEIYCPHDWDDPRAGRTARRYSRKYSRLYGTTYQNIMVEEIADGALHFLGLAGGDHYIPPIIDGSRDYPGGQEGAVRMVREVLGV